MTTITEDVTNNVVYLYDEINKSSILKLNMSLQLAISNCKYVEREYGVLPPVILRVNCNGGCLTDALSVIPYIDNSPVPIHTIVEGFAASAATIISINGHKRLIGKNSYMLIHQLSGVLWGNFEQIKDDMKNKNLLMREIKKLYIEKTNFTEKKLGKLLKRDLYLSAKKCLKYGLVDEIL